MADIRSLLRNERAQRRINHPQASYSATGTLGCSVCHIPLKSDAEVWDKHLKSTQHAMRQERLRLSTYQRPESTNLPERVGEVSSREVSAGSKKRKASDGDDESRKKTRPVVEMPGEFVDDIIEANNGIRPQEREGETADGASKPLQDFVRATDAAPNTGPVSTLPESSSQIATVKSSNPIDEDEWAAFERDVATPPPDSSVASAFTAAATISAAPVTAAELAAQSREQASLQGRERREVEMDGEKEDAARALEEEFDEMEGLEERVRRMREKREELRRKRDKEVDERPENDGEKDVEGKRTGGVQEDEESEDEEDEDGWGAWGS